MRQMSYLEIGQHRSSSPIVLIVEDDDAEAELARRVVTAGEYVADFCIAGDGEEALRRLRCRDAHDGRRRPDLVLLDLNMPGPSGIDVLKRIRDDAELADVPVVMLSTSTHERDVLASYRAGANSYVEKPSTADGLARVLQLVEDYWFGIVTRPQVGV